MIEQQEYEPGDQRLTHGFRNPTEDLQEMPRGRFKPFKPRENSANQNGKRYYAGQKVNLVTTTGASIEGRLGVANTSAQTGEFHIGERTYTPSRFRKAITIGVDEKSRPYIEVGAVK